LHVEVFYNGVFIFGLSFAYEFKKIKLFVI